MKTNFRSLDKKGRVPPDEVSEDSKRMRGGRKVAYRTEDLLEWLSSRTMRLS